MLVGQAALAVSIVIGGLSPGVGVYVVAALFLGVFFATQSGTFESIAYDTVLEETGDSTAFERTIGRIRSSRAWGSSRAPWWAGCWPKSCRSASPIS